MNIIEDWRWVLKRAWSVRLLIIAAILSGLEVTLQVCVSYGIHFPIPDGTFAVLAGVVSLAAIVARFWAQVR